MNDYDLIVRGGMVVDGTGQAERRADVAVREGLIVEVGKVDGRAAEEVEADGARGTPGVVDVNTHRDGQAAWANGLAPSSHHAGTPHALLTLNATPPPPATHRAHDDAAGLQEVVDGGAFLEELRI